MFLMEQNLGVENHLEDTLKEQDQVEFHRRDRFTDFMFGQRSSHHQSHEQERDVNSNPNYIDYEQLMFHIDSFIESTKDLKPFFKKFQPFIEQFWKKK
jgi:hypothetical protein